jgi:hypothetical protein
MDEKIMEVSLQAGHILLENGADRNSKDHNGKTPVELTESKTIKKLLEA